MNIDSIQIKDFKQHKDKEVHFEDGLNVIVGRNYSGKTTILQAILVALQGASVVDENASDIINDGAKDFRLVLKLSNGYTLTRTSKNAAVDNADGVNIVNGHTAVNKHITDLLGMPKASFFKIFVSQQGEPQELLRMDGPALTKFVEEAVGMDKLNRVIKLLGSKTNDLKVSIQALESIMPTDRTKEELEADMLQLDLDVKALASKQDELKKDRDTVTALLEDFNSQLREILANRTEWAGYDTTKKNLLNQMEGLIEPAKVEEIDTGDIEKELEVVSDLLKKAEDSRLLYKKLTSKKNSILADLKSTQEDYDRYSGVKAPELDIDILREDLASARDSYTSLTEKITHQKHKIDNASCPTCQRPYEQEFDKDVEIAALKELEQSLANAESLYGEKARYVKATEAAAKQYEQATAMLQKASALLDLHNKDLAEVERDLLAVQVIDASAREDAERKAELLTKQLKAYKRSNETSNSARSMLQALNKQLGMLVEPVVLPYDYDHVTKRCGELRDHLSGTAERITELAVAISEKKSNLEYASSAIAKLDDISRKIDAQQMAMVRHASLQKYLTDNRVALLDEIWKTLFASASEFVSTVTGGDIERVFLSDSGIRYVEGGRVRNKWSASGAQKTLIGLGLKLGLAQLVPCPFNSLILDEISADFDNEISLACLTAMQDYCEQAIIVSHREYDVAGNTISL